MLGWVLGLIWKVWLCQSCHLFLFWAGVTSLSLPFFTYFLFCSLPSLRVGNFELGKRLAPLFLLLRWERGSGLCHMRAAVKCKSRSAFSGMDETPEAEKDCFSFSIKQKFSLVEDNQFVFPSKIDIAFQGVEHEQFDNKDLQLKVANIGHSRELCLINRWGRQFRIPYASLVSLHENLQQHHLGHIELKPPDSLRIICRALPAVNVPLNLRSSKRESLNEKLKLQKRRTKSSSDLNNILFECKTTAAPGKVALNPLVQWIADTIEGKDAVQSLIRHPIISLANDLNSVKAIEFSGSRCSGIVASSPMQCSSLSKKPSIRRQRCGSEIPEKMEISSSSTESSISCSSCGFTSKAVLCCTSKNGTPHLEFSVDGKGEAYEATSVKLEFPCGKYPGYMYLFRNRSNDFKDRKRFGSNVVGRMKVSSCLTLDSSNDKVVETEFTLVGSAVLADQLQASNVVSDKGNFVTKKMVNAIKASTPHLPLIGLKFRKHPSLSRPFFSGELNEVGRELDDCFSPNFELAAIIVKDPVDEKIEEASVGGWGLKFLEKARVPNVTPKSQSTMTMNFVIPAGFHGGPVSLKEGPSSLIERWRTGGHCDCGGWDTGCPVTVFSTDRPLIEDGIPQTDLQDDSTLELFKMGSRVGEPSLRVVNVHQGLYNIHFDSALSALQAFSVAVASIHTRSKDLRELMYKS